ncbi:BTAD domain-containing putative transcriptional regulator [Pseudarthrobacter sulfonivorans]|uniref:BTAD domain-containing putative transcriptional regulator n=1 Tax=Pseudarthrobacter sulfonivorans TaxID=121292 RepID=UPI000B00EF96|nr:BTAD domain-containing putative transcriptional regulator [Pseudarthrobacter sulfonivorans]
MTALVEGEVRIRLLGGFRVSVGSRDIPDGEWRLRKAKAVVKLLALAPGHRLQREQVLDYLWPGLDPDAASGQLRKVVHEARLVLDPSLSALDRYLISGEQLRLDRESTWVDVEAFEAAAMRARRTGDPAAYAAAIRLYDGDLLPEDRYEDWAITREGALRSDFLALLVEQARLLEARANFDGAVSALRRVIAADPIHEEAGVALMRVHALAGRRHEAMQEHERLRAALDRELGIEPDPATERLFEQIRTGLSSEPELASELLEQVGGLRLVSGDFQGAVAAFVAAVARLRGSSANHRLARLHRKAAQAHLMMQDAAAAESHLRAAEGLLAGRKDEAEKARVLEARANWLWSVGRYDEAQSAAEASLAAAEVHGTGEDVAAVQETLAIICHMRGAWRPGLQAEIERLGDVGGEDPRLGRIFEFYCCIGEYHLYGDGLCETVEDYARGTLALAIGRGARHAQAFAWCLLGESLLLQGRWDEAAGCLERSTELYAELDARSGALPWQRLAELAVMRGDSIAAAAYLRHGMAIAVVSPLARHAWGRLYATAALDALERRDPAEAVRVVRSAAATAARYGECPTCTALLYPMAAEAFAALGDRAGATVFAQAAERVGQSFQSSAWTAMAESARGSLALTDADAGGARERFLSAARLYERAHQPFWSARCRLQAALAGAGGLADRHLLDDAAIAFEQLGALRALAAARRAT